MCVSTNVQVPARSLMCSSKVQRYCANLRKVDYWVHCSAPAGACFVRSPVLGAVWNWEMYTLPLKGLSLLIFLYNFFLLHLISLIQNLFPLCQKEKRSPVVTFNNFQLKDAPIQGVGDSPTFESPSHFLCGCLHRYQRSGQCLTAGTVEQAILVHLPGFHWV